VPDAAQAVAGRLRRARAALAARTRQMHGPLPMLPRKLLPRPASPAPATLEGQTLLAAKEVHYISHQTAVFACSHCAYNELLSFDWKLTVCTLVHTNKTVCEYFDAARELAWMHSTMMAMANDPWVLLLCLLLALRISFAASCTSGVTR